MTLRSDAEALLAHARQEDTDALELLKQPGPPVRVSVLCRITGFSRTPFVEAIETGELCARLVGRGRGRYYVDRAEALRFLRAIKFAA